MDDALPADRIWLIGVLLDEDLTRQAVLIGPADRTQAQAAFRQRHPKDTILSIVSLAEVEAAAQMMRAAATSDSAEAYIGDVEILDATPAEDATGHAEAEQS